MLVRFCFKNKCIYVAVVKKCCALRFYFHFSFLMACELRTPNDMALFFSSLLSSQPCHPFNYDVIDKEHFIFHDHRTQHTTYNSECNRSLLSQSHPTTHIPTNTLKMKRVCLFGLSANPPTGNGGHVGIVKALSALPLHPQQENSQEKFDEIRVLPVYRHMFAVSLLVSILHII